MADILPGQRKGDRVIPLSLRKIGRGHDQHTANLAHAHQLTQSDSHARNSRAINGGAQDIGFLHRGVNRLSQIRHGSACAIARNADRYAFAIYDNVKRIFQRSRSRRSAGSDDLNAAIICTILRCCAKQRSHVCTIARRRILITERELTRRRVIAERHIAAGPIAKGCRTKTGANSRIDQCNHIIHGFRTVQINCNYCAIARFTICPRDA